jgi:hypothetical protein
MTLKEYEHIYFYGGINRFHLVLLKKQSKTCM